MVWQDIDNGENGVQFPYRYRVMLVDDEEEVRKSIIRKIDWTAVGFAVVGDAENGEDALEKIENLEPDVVLTDIRMPYMDGLTLAERIRQKYPSMKIVIFSGYDDFEYAKQAIKLNVTEYILKPVNVEELTAGKPRLIVLNRIDVADGEATRLWAAWFRTRGAAVLEVNAREGQGTARFAAAVRELLADKLTAYAEKGQVGRTLRVMILGIPIPYVSINSRRYSTDARPGFLREDAPAIMSSIPRPVFNPPMDTTDNLSLKTEIVMSPLIP